MSKIEEENVNAGSSGSFLGRTDRSRQSAFVRDLFNETATDYDAVNRVFSLGSGAWYRRRCLRRAGLRPGMRVIDVAVGTGLVAREVLHLIGENADIVGLDLSEGMLAETRRLLHIPVIQGRAEALPLADASVDFVTMGFALRHVADLTATLAEFWRVLRPGGTVLLLETTRPRFAFYRAFARFYLSRLVPLACRLGVGARSAQLLLEYCWETTERCVPPVAIIAAMNEAGLTGIRSGAHFDLFRNYVGFKV